METKPPTSVRLSTEAKRLLKKLAEQLGISRSAIIELAIRDYAAKKKVK